MNRFLPALFVLAAGPALAQQPAPELQPDLRPPNVIEDLTIRGDETGLDQEEELTDLSQEGIHEIRDRGRVVEVVVQPRNAPPYTLSDSNHDGTINHAYDDPSELDANPLQERVLFRW